MWGGSSLNFQQCSEKMAAKPTDALKKLEEQLTCSVCLDQLTAPKTLSCLHSFCHKCLEELTDFNNGVRCPTCRSSFELGEDGVDSLQTAFLVNNLMEVHGMLKKVGSDKMVICDVCGESFATGYCQQCESFSCDSCLSFHNKWKKNVSHRVLTLEELADSAYDLPRAKSEVIMKCPNHNKPLDIYCETCDQLICQHCTVRIHRDHEYDVVNDIYDNQREAIETSIEPIDRLIKEGKTHMKSLMARKDSLTKRGDKIKEDIQERVGVIMDKLFLAANGLSREVDVAINREERSVEEKIQEVDSLLRQLSACKEYIEQSLSVGSPQQVLSCKGKLIEHSEGVIKACDFSSFQLLEEFEIKFDGHVKLNKLTISNLIGRIHSCTVIQEKVKHSSSDSCEVVENVMTEKVLEVPIETCTGWLPPVVENNKELPPVVLMTTTLDSVNSEDLSDASLGVVMPKALSDDDESMTFAIQPNKEYEPQLDKEEYEPQLIAIMTNHEDYFD